MAYLGSFTASVDLPEFLRPWALAGVEAFFLPDGAEAAARSFRDMAAGPRPVTRFSAEPASFVSPQTVRTAEPAASPARTVAFPEPWAGLARRVVGSPRVIITYAELCDDMLGATDPLRAKVLRKVMRYLSWPRGTSLFWPLFPAGGDATAATMASDLFVQGVTRFNVGCIAAFGDAVIERCCALYPQEDRTPPIVVYALPSPEELAGLLPHEFQGRLNALKELRFV